MRAGGESLGAAMAVDGVLRRLMPAPPAILSYAQVARVCDCSPRTPKTWLLTDDEIVVPVLETRDKLLALVREKVDEGAGDTLASAWSRLLAETAPGLDGGDGTAAQQRDDGSKPLSLADQRLILEQAELVLAQGYAHLPLKRALHAVNPVQRLRLLASRLATPDATALPEVHFHRQMIDIFTSMRDRHTSYVVPSRYRRAMSRLPFRVEQYFEQTEDGHQVAVYVATKVEDSENLDSGFAEGVVISHWNAVPIERAIELLAERQAIGNAPAAFARALNTLTVRPLLSSLAPDEFWVDVTFTTLQGERAEQRFEWTEENAPDDLLGDHLKVALAIDAETDAVSELRKELYGRSKDNAWSVEAEDAGSLASPIGMHETHVETHMPWSFKAHPTEPTSDTDPDAGRFGIVRIYNFKTKRPAEFVAEFERLTTLLPQDGLIVDVRGNGGGSIVAAEGCLQVLVDEDVQPCRAQFVTSPLMLDICRRHSKAGGAFGLALGPWIRSMGQAVATGSPYSVGFPITPQSVLDQVQHRYPGPVVLIVDALCYSATDMFAAGFVDHGGGSVVGTADNTGAGGANVWRHSDLLRLAPDHGQLKKLPSGIDMRFAVRRTTRVRLHEGEILEDLGIAVTHRHYMTQADLLERNRDLVRAASNELRASTNE